MPNTLRRFTFIAFGLALFLAGCDPYDGLDSAGEPTLRPESDWGLAESRAPELAQLAIAERLPGFAGFHVEGDRLVAMVTDEGDPEDARRELLETVALTLARPTAPLPQGVAAARHEPWNVVVRHARYSYPQLIQWRDRLNAHLLALDGVVTTSVSVRDNGIQVGLSDPSAEREVIRIFERNGVPVYALVITADSYRSNATLRDYQRPIVGGLILAGDGHSHGAGCTLGFTAMQSGAKRLVTVSHCSPRMWRTDYNYYYNHVAIADETHYVGLEYYDPAGWSCGLFWLSKCRNSDAAIVAVGPYVDFRLGSIARTTGSRGPTDPWVWNRSGSITINDAAPYFRIIGSVSSPPQGYQVHKMGQRTGWTYGTILNNCVDLKVSGTSNILKCQVVADYYATLGDSGAPVFSAPYGGDVRLYGIHHGNNDDATRSYFSPMGGITKDLGSMSVIDPNYTSPPPPTEGCDDVDPETGMIQPC